MLARKKIKSSRYLAAFAITIIVFLIGFIASSEISRNKFDKLAYVEQDLRIDSLGSELMLQLVQKDICAGLNISSYNSELSEYGKRVTYLESLSGYSAEDVVRLKNYYSLLEIRHWMLAEAMNEKCNETKPLVLYFYSNYYDCIDCEDQGLVLTNLHQNYPFFNIYSFEYALNNSAVDFMKEKYSIKQNSLPTVVIDGTVYYGFQSKEKLIELMDLERRLAEDKALHPEIYK